MWWGVLLLIWEGREEEMKGRLGHVGDSEVCTLERLSPSFSELKFGHVDENLEHSHLHLGSELGSVDIH